MQSFQSKLYSLDTYLAKTRLEPTSLTRDFPRTTFTLPLFPSLPQHTNPKHNNLTNQRFLLQIFHVEIESSALLSPPKSTHLPSQCYPHPITAAVRFHGEQYPRSTQVELKALFSALVFHAWNWLGPCLSGWSDPTPCYCRLVGLQWWFGTLVV
jgi:hypothetical protein